LPYLTPDRFKLFPISKMDFCPFLKLQKMEFGQDFFVKWIYLISRIFLAWTFFNFLAHCVPVPDLSLVGHVLLQYYTITKHFQDLLPKNFFQ